MSLRSAILAAATLCAYVADAHVVMKSPVPYSVDKLDNSPITKTQFPCKSQNGFTISTMNSMKAGEEQELKLFGSAVHGGGSCQLSVTLDMEPTASSVFKVIKSMEGGCPAVSGDAGTHKFTLPDSIPNGKATFAWTWFSKLSGGPELYMNCAPIEVTGGASDDTKFKALPNMLVANIDDTCKSVPNFAVQFPDPGTVVENGGTNDLKAPTGTGCGATGTTPADPSSPAGSGAPASSAAASAAPSSAGGNDGMYTPPGGASSAAATSAAATSAAAAPTSAAVTSAAAVPSSAAGEVSAAPSAVTSAAAATSAAASGGAGGVFAPGASSAAAVASTQTTLVTVTGTPAVPAQSTAAASAPAAATSAAAGTGSAAAPTTAPAASGDGTCSTDGAIVCNGTTQFGLCNQGKVVWQAVAAGTTCSNGSIQKRGYNGRIVRRARSFVGHVHKH